MQLFLCLHLLLAVVTTLTAANYICKANKNCGCGRGGDGSQEFVCPKFSEYAILKLSVLQKTTATLSCTDANSVKYEWLDGNPVGPVQSFVINSCPLPKVTLSDFMSNLGVSDIVKLALRGSHINETLNNQSLRGLGHVKDLQLYNLGRLELPDGVFSDMANLTSLDLRNNEISLPLNVFKDVINLERLELANSNLVYLEPGIFQYLINLKLLNLWGNSLRNLSKETFTGLSNLTSLGLNNNNISMLPADVFMNMENLKNISLYGNNFTSLPEGLFSGMPKLEHLRLHNNRNTLKTLPRGFLANLTALQGVYLQDCNITQLPEDLLWGSFNVATVKLSRNLLSVLSQHLFRDARKLKVLDISYNKLKTLPDDMFLSTSELHSLYLDHNELSTLNESTLEGLTELKKLYLNNNNLHLINSNTFRSTRNLMELYLSYNHISFNDENSDSFGQWSPVQHCINLEVLELANNSITEVCADWRNTLSKLYRLDLRNNLIQHLEATDINFISNNITVDLGYNPIKCINLQLAEIFALHSTDSSKTGRNATVKLYGNSLQCDCCIYHFLQYLDDRLHPGVRQIMNLVPDNLFCAGPEYLAWKPVTQLHSITHTCKLRSFCPVKCSCYFRPSDQVHIVNCIGMGLTEAPAALPNPKTHIELLLDKNFIRALPEPLPASYARVTKLSLSYNNISWLSNTSLPPNITDMYLDHNNLTHLNSSVLERWTNKTNVSLHGNPWICDCEALDFFNFLQSNYKQVEFLNNVTCQDGQSLARMTANEVCQLTDMIVAISVTIAVVGIIVGLLIALYFRYQNEIKIWLYAHSMCLWFVTEEELDKDKMYDAFVSYSHKDEDFVTDKLIPGLENGPIQFKLCMHYRDWIVGEFITTQIIRSVQQSRRTLVVLSPNFIKSEWGRLEFRAAHKQALSEGRARVIVVLYGDIGPVDNLDNELRTYLSTNTYVKWGDPWFWDKLRYALPHPPKKMKVPMLSRRGSQFRDPVGDKLELINPSTPPAVTTPPTDISVNPLDSTNGYLNKGCATKLMEENGHVNGVVKCV